MHFSEPMEHMRPVVYSFADYREFLKTLIEFERNGNSFSYSRFALRSGFQSRSYLRTVVTGKRNLSNDAISKVILGFSFDFNEGEAFRALVNFNQASDFEERRKYWELFLDKKPNEEKSQRVRDEYMYLARMAYPILLILLRQPHINKDNKTLATLTGLNEEQVNEGVETLIHLGAVTRIGLDFQVTAKGFTTSNDIPNIAIQTFHNNMMEKAKESLSLHPLEREFQSMMVALNEDEFTYLRRRLRSLMEEVQMKFGGCKPQSNKIYAFNANLIPVTPEFIRENASQKSEENVTEKTKRNVS